VEAGQFDSAAAWRIIERQVDMGQRPAGSPQLRKLADELRPLLPSGRFEPIPGEPALRNIVGTLPGRRPAIVLGAHYDTLAKPPGFVGANNGAAGTAVVIEVARALRQLGSDDAGRQVNFVLFDGEEPPAHLPEEGANFYSEGLRGSRAYVASHPGGTAAMILVDYVGGRGLRLPREANSDAALWGHVIRAAGAVGAARYFSNAAVPGVIDDHSPFLRTGVPAVDLIDWSYPGHDLRDSLNLLSRRSVDGVGETIVRLVRELREE
jgi:glutaminyl-peptide cyclotransferase